LVAKPFQSSEEKVNALRLPDVNDKNIKNKIATLKKERDTKIPIRHLDPSKYGEKGITPELLKKVVYGMKVLKSVEWIDLRFNKLDDSYSNVLGELLGIDTLKRVDLAHNSLNKVAVKKPVNILKIAKHLEYFDTSSNPTNDETVRMNLCNAIRFHDKIFHFDLSDLSKNAAVNFIHYKSELRSPNIDDARHKLKAYETITIFLTEKRYNLAVPSMRYNNLDPAVAHSIAKGLRLNKTLVHINLHNRGITDLAREKITNASETNKNPAELDLSKNKPADLRSY
jgi:Ran GTPase-activating protein (RanGAP) involved in mRNA processing and transport